MDISTEKRQEILTCIGHLTPLMNDSEDVLRRVKKRQSEAFHLERKLMADLQSAKQRFIQEISQQTEQAEARINAVFSDIFSYLREEEERINSRYLPMKHMINLSTTLARCGNDAEVISLGKQATNRLKVSSTLPPEEKKIKNTDVRLKIKENIPQLFSVKGFTIQFEKVDVGIPTTPIFRYYPPPPTNRNTMKWYANQDTLYSSYRTQGLLTCLRISPAYRYPYRLPLIPSYYQASLRDQIQRFSMFSTFSTRTTVSTNAQNRSECLTVDNVQPLTSYEEVCLSPSPVSSSIELSSSCVTQNSLRAASSNLESISPSTVKMSEKKTLTRECYVILTEVRNCKLTGDSKSPMITDICWMTDATFVVADKNNKVVKIFDTKGKFLWKINSIDIRHVAYVDGIVVCSCDNYISLHEKPERLGTINFQSTHGRTHPVAKGLHTRSIVVANIDNAALREYTKDGKRIDYVELDTNITAKCMVKRKGKKIVLLQNRSSNIMQISSAGNVTHFYAHSEPNWSPSAITVDSDDNIYATDIKSNTVVKVSAEGTYLDTIKLQIDGISGLTVNTAHIFLVSDGGGNVYRFTWKTDAH